MFVVYAILACAAMSAAQTDAASEVRKLERAWLDAYEQNDVKAMESIVADGFVITFPNGAKQTKAEIIEMLKRAPKDPSRGTKHRTEDVKAKVDGEKVVLTGRVISEFMVDGKVVSREESLYTDTYEKRAGRWQVIVSYLTEPKADNKKQ